MKLIFIRHAEPDYAHDSLTEKGFREARILSERTKNWRVTQFYCSPLGRAQATAKPTLDAHHVTLTTVYPDPAPDVILQPDASKAIVYPWLRELHAPVDPSLHPTGKQIPWDLTPEYLNANPILLDQDHWWEAPLMQSCDMKQQYDWISNGIDRLLAVHGYTRDSMYYKTDGSSPASDAFMEYNGATIAHLQNADQEEPVIVIFCHLAVMMIMMSHLLHTSPHTLLHGIFVPPASVTVLSTEERVPGHACFRAQMIGDTSHFRFAGEPVSYYGGFAAPFQG